MRFESKRDLWIVLLLRALPIAILIAIGVSWVHRTGDVRGPLAGALIVIALEVFLFEPIFRSTYYVIDGATLVIRSSFLTWRVPIAEITRVTPTRNPLSSPALSLDRLQIEYGRKLILVSPEEKERFIEALRAVNPAIIRA
jgi:hypothetical protein